MLEALLLSPDQASGSRAKLLDPNLEKAIAAFKKSDYMSMESIICFELARVQQDNYIFLLAYYCFRKRLFKRFLLIHSEFYLCKPSDTLANVLDAFSYHLRQNDDSLNACWDVAKGRNIFEESLIAYLIAQRHFQKGNHDICLQMLDTLPFSVFYEANLLKAQVLSSVGKYSQSIIILDGLIKEYPDDLGLCVQHIITLYDGKYADRIVNALYNALANFGEQAELLKQLASIKLLQRQPGRALRACLIERSQNIVSGTMSRVSNLFVCYEHLGHVQWSRFLSTSNLLPLQLDPDFYFNRCLQLASCGANQLSVQQARLIYDQMPKLSNTIFKYPDSVDSTTSRLKVAWITGDCCNHPVARFLLGMFSSLDGSFSHEHLLISTVEHRAEESWTSHFNAINGVKVLSLQTEDSMEKRLEYLRGLKLDVAIDLSGLTGGHILPLFKERFALCQINYLGYFASTGLPSMDFWLGDHALFPPGFNESRSEALYRLPRSFIAWNPVELLPEYHAAISEPPCEQLKLGTFNHNRKFSNQILQIWSQLLSELPMSRLVFKANATDDPQTQDLLERRLRRADIDPQRIDWLPLTRSASSHLEQYRRIDLALDCYPNGGCTTTCEALWMGVPTVTLAGDSYASRMSTAVLTAAGLSNLIANSPQEYIDIVKREVSNLSNFRKKRTMWRQKLKNSQLGNSAGLMRELETSFIEMYNIRKSVTSY